MNTPENYRAISFESFRVQKVQVFTPNNKDHGRLPYMPQLKNIDNNANRFAYIKDEAHRHH